MSTISGIEADTVGFDVGSSHAVPHRLRQARGADVMAKLYPDWVSNQLWLMFGVNDIPTPGHGG
jgi:hypothetical protein